MYKWKKIKWLFSFFFVSIPLTSLTSCEVDSINKEDFINNMFPNFFVFITHIISAIVLIILLFFFVWKPAKNLLEKRHNFIKQQIDDATETSKKATIEFNKANQIKIESIANAKNIIDQAKNDATNIINDAKIEAKKTSAQIIKDNKEYIENEKKQIKINAQSNIINIAFDVAETILNDEIKSTKNKDYLDDLLKLVEEKYIKNEKVKNHE